MTDLTGDAVHPRHPTTGHLLTNRLAPVPLTRRELREQERTAAVAPAPQTRKQRRKQEDAASDVAAETAISDEPAPAEPTPAVNGKSAGLPDTVPSHLPATPISAQAALTPTLIATAASIETPVRPVSTISTPARLSSAGPVVPRPPRRRGWFPAAVILATIGLVSTVALPAYGYTGNPDSISLNASAAALGAQSLTVAGIGAPTPNRDSYKAIGNVAEYDSTLGTTVSPTVQALAAELMADVAAGKLVGSVPDHIKEIRSLANGQAVAGCGVDYRVLQLIQVAVKNFDKVGVSDINRHCTGQIEGAGTASSHYANGGGHAVDFYILNGHSLTGGDSDSMKLIRILEPLVPSGTDLGQSQCRSSNNFNNFAPFQDTCDHLHIDFGHTNGVSLSE